MLLQVVTLSHTPTARPSRRNSYWVWKNHRLIPCSLVVFYCLLLAPRSTTQEIETQRFVKLAMVVEKRRSASAALMDLSSSDDEAPVQIPPPSASESAGRMKKKMRKEAAPYNPPALNPPVAVAVAGPSASVEVEICEVDDGAIEAAISVDSVDDDYDVVDVSSGSDDDIEEVPVEKSEAEKRIAEAVKTGGKGVEQGSARYFMMDSVLCSFCGISGHLSYECPEEPDEVRCFLCGKPGHTSQSCDQEACFYCHKTGHRASVCPAKLSGLPPVRFQGPSRGTRPVSPPRPVRLVCYVCGKDGHVDCSLAKASTTAMSCCNCGNSGHCGGQGSGCPEPPADRWVQYAAEHSRGQRGRGGRGGRGRGRGGTRGGKVEPPTPQQVAQSVAESQKFKDEMCQSVRSGRGNFGGGRGGGGPGRSWRNLDRGGASRQATLRR